MIGTHVVRDTPKPGVRVVRFVRPELSEFIYDADDIADCTLYKELAAAGLTGLAPGETVVANLGLVDKFPTGFYRLFDKLEREITAKGGKLSLCCVTPNAAECLRIMKATDRFVAKSSESQAVYDATH